MNQQLISIFLFVLLIAGCTTTKLYEKHPNPDHLYPIGQDGKWGYVDSTGFIQITPRYADAQLFHHGLAVAKLGEKYGYINQTGDWVIQPNFDQAKAFYFGCAETVLNGEQVYITRKGKKNDNCELWNFVTGCIPPKPPSDPNDFAIENESKFALTYDNHSDTTKFIYDAVRKFSHQFILVQLDGKWGFHYIERHRDQWGNIKLREPLYQEVRTKYEVWGSEIENGRITYAEIKNNDKWGLLNAFTLEEVISPKYLSLDRSQHEKYILVQFQKDHFGYIDYTGNEYFKRDLLPRKTTGVLR